MTKWEKDFDEHGIAKTDRGRRIAHRVTTWAIEAFTKCLEDINHTHPHVQTRTIRIGGSRAHPTKHPRHGIYPKRMQFEYALHGEAYKHIVPADSITHPSDVDVIADIAYKHPYEVGCMDEDGFMHKIHDAERLIFTRYRTLVMFLIQNHDSQNGATTPAEQFIHTHKYK